MGGSRTNVRARREMRGISGVHISQGISEGYVAYPSLILRGESGLMCGGILSRQALTGARTSIYSVTADPSVGAENLHEALVSADSNPAVKGRMRRKTVVHPRARLPMVHPTDADSPNLISPILPKTTGTKHWNKQRRARASDFENECAGPSFGLISVNFVYEVCARFAVAAFCRCRLLFALLVAEKRK